MRLDCVIQYMLQMTQGILCTKLNGNFIHKLTRKFFDPPGRIVRQTKPNTNFILTKITRRMLQKTNVQNDQYTCYFWSYWVSLLWVCVWCSFVETAILATLFGFCLQSSTMTSIRVVFGRIDFPWYKFIRLFCFANFRPVEFWQSWNRVCWYDHWWYKSAISGPTELYKKL